MRQIIIVIGLLAILMGAASCSTTPAPYSLRSSATTTTLPAPVAVGTTVALSTTKGIGASGRFTINRIWRNVTPQFDASAAEPPGTTFNQAVSRDLQNAHLPHGQPLMWMGIDLTIKSTGQSTIGLGVAGGPGAAALYFVVNGRGALLNEESRPDLLATTGYEMGVSGCPFPFPPAATLAPGTSFSGCVAIAVPVGVKVSTVGFDLQPAIGGPVQQVAQWTV